MQDHLTPDPGSVPAAAIVLQPSGSFSWFVVWRLRSAPLHHRQLHKGSGGGQGSDVSAKAWSCPLLGRGEHGSPLPTLWVHFNK